MVRTDIFPQFPFKAIRAATTEKRCISCNREMTEKRHKWSLQQWRTYQGTGYCAQCQVEMTDDDIDPFDFKYGGTA